MLSLLLSLVSAGTTPTYYFSTALTPPAPCAPLAPLDPAYRFGPCSSGGVPGVLYGPHAKYYAAIAGGASHCGEAITMTYNGNSVQLVVMDECPGCTDGHVDMSFDALMELTGSEVQACAIGILPITVEWSFGASSSLGASSSSSDANSPAASSSSSWTPAWTWAPEPSSSPLADLSWKAASLADSTPAVTSLDTLASPAVTSLDTAPCATPTGKAKRRRKRLGTGSIRHVISSNN